MIPRKGDGGKGSRWYYNYIIFLKLACVGELIRIRILGLLFMVKCLTPVFVDNFFFFIRNNKTDRIIFLIKKMLLLLNIVFDLDFSLDTKNFKNDDAHQNKFSSFLSQITLTKFVHVTITNSLTLFSFC